MTPRRASEEVWYKRWYIPGLLTVAIGAAVALLQAAATRLRVDVPPVAYLSLLVAAMVFSLSWTIERHWTKIPDQLRDDVSKIRDDIVALTGR
ncbi:MAG TPA: hypothetical protein VEW03_05775, partial [Longimicrobiaceae bacterium]|nr:hypothetical protein [Longimicrobiaceae bacterium]